MRQDRYAPALPGSTKIKDMAKADQEDILDSSFPLRHFASCIDSPVGKNLLPRASQPKSISIQAVAELEKLFVKEYTYIPDKDLQHISLPVAELVIYLSSCWTPKQRLRIWSVGEAIASSGNDSKLETIRCGRIAAWAAARGAMVLRKKDLPLSAAAIDRALPSDNLSFSSENAKNIGNILISIQSGQASAIDTNSAQTLAYAITACENFCAGTFAWKRTGMASISRTIARAAVQSSNAAAALLGEEAVIDSQLALIEELSRMRERV